MASRAELALAVAAAAGLCACEEPRAPDLQRLSGWAVLDSDGEALPDTHVYRVAAPLFSDEAAKQRFLWLPPGRQIDDADVGIWGFPVGSVLGKTFAYPVDVRDPGRGEHRVETRLLVREAAQWVPYIYAWTAEQDDAQLLRFGATVDVAWVDASGDARTLAYRIPNTNDCQSCHGEREALAPLGPKTLQLNRLDPDGTRQLGRLQAVGVLRSQGDPALRPAMPDPAGAEPVSLRARAYLDANCAHCHREAAPADSSGLRLEWEVTDSKALGVCRRPFSAGTGTGGRRYDIVPGEPDASILVFRMASADPEIKMPELPTQLPDDAGVALVSAWIEALPDAPCD